MDARAQAVTLLANQFWLLNIFRSLYKTELYDPYKVVGAELPLAGTTVTVTREMVSEAIGKAHRDHIAWEQDYASREENRRESV